MQSAIQHQHISYSKEFATLFSIEQVLPICQEVIKDTAKTEDVTLTREFFSS
jgi:hypothetical protein